MSYSDVFGLGHKQPLSPMSQMADTAVRRRSGAQFVGMLGFRPTSRNPSELPGVERKCRL